MGEGEKPSSSSEDALFAELARAPDVIPSSAMLGQKLGRYAIEAVLGRGGMGIVYRARDTVLDRDVALKLVPPEVLGDVERRARFIREARSGAAANHPNIAAVYDVGEIDGRVFLAMELVEGESLRTRLARGALPPEEATTIVRAIARGLAKAHEKGILHRDLKPDNVMIGDEVKLLDFGLAKLRAEKALTGEVTSTVEGRVLGTPAYMSPEQARGRELDGRSDLFSLGVVGHEMLTGERPFRGDSAIEILSAVIRDPPPALPATVPERLRAVIERCLEKEPSSRFASAKDLLAELDGMPSSSNVVGSAAAKGVAPAKSVAPAANRTLPRVLAAAAGALLIGGAALLSRHREPPQVPAVTTVDASPTGRAVTDHPKPPSSSPEALAAYSAALQDTRDGSMALAIQDFERATRLDPSLAAAHLRIVFLGLFTGALPRLREHSQAAVQHRASLEQRDAELLQASEEIVRDKPDQKAIADRVSKVAAHFPDDAEIALFASSALANAGRLEDAKVAARRARSLDPSYAAALWYEASLVQDEDPETSLKLLDECIRMSPSAPSCLRVRSNVRIARGDCRGFEADARRMTEIEPLGPRAYEFLAAALAARGAPLESVRAALEKRASLGAPGTREAAEMQAQTDLWVALLAGDFTTAEVAALTLEKLVDTDTSEGSHVLPTITLIDIYEERGELDRALATAEAFAKRVPAWTPNAASGVRARLVELRHRLGKIDDAEATKQREALMREEKEYIPEEIDAQFAVYRWLAVEAQYADTEAEAKSALAQKPRDNRLRGFDFWALGKVELRAGKRKEAIASLQKAVASCTTMPTTDDRWSRLPFVWVEAQLLLGEALEEDNHSASCDAYAKVIDRWKDARPRSVSVEKARTRAKAHGCAHT